MLQSPCIDTMWNQEQGVCLKKKKMLQVSDSLGLQDGGGAGVESKSPGAIFTAQESISLTSNIW